MYRGSQIGIESLKYVKMGRHMRVCHRMQNVLVIKNLCFVTTKRFSVSSLTITQY